MGASEDRPTGPRDVSPGVSGFPSKVGLGVGCPNVVITRSACSFAFARDSPAPEQSPLPSRAWRCLPESPSRRGQKSRSGQRRACQKRFGHRISGGRPGAEIRLRNRGPPCGARNTTRALFKGIPNRSPGSSSLPASDADAASASASDADAASASASDSDAAPDSDSDSDADAAPDSAPAQGENDTGYFTVVRTPGPGNRSAANPAVMHASNPGSRSVDPASMAISATRPSG